MSVEKDVYSYLIYNHNVFSRLFHVYRFSGALIPRAAFVKGLRAALCVVTVGAAGHLTFKCTTAQETDSEKSRLLFCNRCGRVGCVRDPKPNVRAAFFLSDVASASLTREGYAHLGCITATCRRWQGDREHSMKKHGHLVMKKTNL